MREKLKECAHCGESPLLLKNRGFTWVACRDDKQCGMETPLFKDEDKAISVWNKRASVRK